MNILLLGLVAAMVLLPPLSFARAHTRFVRARHRGGSALGRAGWILAGFAPLFLNIGYIGLSWRQLLAGQLELGQELAIAVIVSWLAFWGRVAIGRRGMKRSRHSRRRLG